MTNPSTQSFGLEAQRNTVLVVEDDLKLRRLVERLLLKMGSPVQLASEGGGALAMLAEHGDSLCAVYLDLTLPDMSGQVVLEHVHAHDPTLPVVLTSGGHLPAGPSAEFDTTTFLPKPFLPRDLHDALGSAGASPSA
jgi:DNA-binding NtrC family response regulator